MRPPIKKDGPPAVTPAPAERFSPGTAEQRPPKEPGGNLPPKEARYAETELTARSLDQFLRDHRDAEEVVIELAGDLKLPGDLMLARDEPAGGAGSAPSLTLRGRKVTLRVKEGV